MKSWKAIAAMFVLLLSLAVLCLALLMLRGFRATSTPSKFEAVVARSIRDMAIPENERHQKNPFLGDSQALQQGRQDFFQRCAICHGTDGSGRTQIGLHEYPRVPDLRASSTQELTDGEIHYIIENGVQLSGMPGFDSPHRVSGPESWKLTLIVRSLRALSAAELQQQTAAIASAHYVGSEACAKCHANIYQRWKKTPMANVVRDPRTHPDAILPDLSTSTVSKFSESQVAFVYGSIWKQRYFTKMGGDYFPLPVQWDIKTRQWLPYHIPSTGADWWAHLYPPDNMQRPTGPTCDGCHSVDYNIHTKQAAEWNVGCERCHGPGSEHVLHPTRGNIVNPAAMDTVAANDICIQCHSQGRPPNGPIEGKYYDWPVGYHVGLRLQDYWGLENCTLGQTNFYYLPDCTANKNRMQGNDFVQSVMYHHGITCFDCHDVHGTGNYAQLIKPANQLCLDCHGPMSPNGPHEPTLEAHTHHKDGSPGSQCVACHMPGIQSEGVPGSYVHAHTFRFIWPEMTDKYKMPNPCTSCHTSKSTAWAENAMQHWFGPSPWQVR